MLRDSTLEDSGGRGRRWSRLSGYSPRRAELGSRAPSACAVRGRSRDLAAPLTYSLLLVLALERPLWARGAGLLACPSTLRPRPQRPAAHSQTAQPAGSAARALRWSSVGRSSTEPTLGVLGPGAGGAKEKMN